MLHAKNPRPLRSKRRKASNRHPSWSVSSIKTDEAIHRAFLEKLDTPTSLGVWLRYKYGEHAQLIAVKVDQANYLTTAVDKFRRDYAATKYFSKAKGLKTGVNLKEVALDSARTAEAICRETNNKIKSFRNGSVRNPVDSEWFRARQIIASILGPLPRRFNPEGWSPGRTSSAYGDKLSSTHKYASQLDVTWSAQLHALREVRQSPSWSASVLDADGPCSILRSGLNVVRGNVMITVPKSAKTDRVICYEPHANIWLQLSVGSFLKHRLMKFGVNLEDQSINQRKALRGSLTRLLATIDLSMASDTLALELVYELLPIDWALYLDELRSKETLWPDGVWRTNEKFSSMGNGFTFELESLIFYALCCAVANNVSVFGDDIIVPTESFERVKHVLENSGFVLNSAKSFAEGNFRESCGMDAFCGVDCTPVYVRDLPKKISDVRKLHNRIRAFVGREIAPSIGWAKMLRNIRHLFPDHFGPSGYGDGHYHTNFAEATPILARERKRYSGWEGWLFKSIVPVYRVSSLYGDRIFGRFSGKFSYAVLCTATGPRRTRGAVNSVSDRRLVVHKTMELLAHEWPDVTYV